MKISVLKVTEVLVCDKADITRRADGSVIANPRVGRIGIQLYRGDELGRKDLPVVRVWRPEAEVMDKTAMSSITHRPLTNDHPPEPVTKDNWKKYSVGHTGDTVARDGDFIRVPMMLSDGAAIAAFDAGKKELSLGYTSNLEWRDGTTPQGDKYDAVQTTIRVNHLALVDAARGGTKLAVGDSDDNAIVLEAETIAMAQQMIAAGKVVRDAYPPKAKHIGNLIKPRENGGTCYPFISDGTVYRGALESIRAEAVTSQHEQAVACVDDLLKLIDASKRTKKMSEKQLVSIVVDGVPIEMDDVSAAVVRRRVGALEEQARDLGAKLTAAELKGKKDAEMSEEEKLKLKKQLEGDAATIATLKKQLADAQMTPAKLDALVRDRAETVGRASALLGDKLTVDGKTDAEMRRQVVDAKLGDTAKGWSDDAVLASFTTLTADVKPEQIAASDAMRRTFSGAPNNNGGGNGMTNDAAKRYDAYDNTLSNAWKNPQGHANQ